MKITKDCLEKLMQENKSINEIAKIFNCSETTIYRNIKKFNLKKDKPIYQNEEWLKKELINKDILTIANDVNVDHHTISRWIKRFNIDISKIEKRHLYRNKEWLTNQSFIFNSISELCNKYNFKECTVRCWANKFNIELK